jgi:hypothetical protein
MKKKILLIMIMLLLYAIIVSCESCTSTSAQSLNEKVMSRDTIYEKDTIKKVTSKKKSDPISVDTVWQANSVTLHNRIEKQKCIMKEQQKKVDSLLTKKRK